MTGESLGSDWNSLVSRTSAAAATATPATARAIRAACWRENDSDQQPDAGLKPGRMMPSDECDPGPSSRCPSSCAITDDGSGVDGQPDRPADIVRGCSEVAASR